MFDSLLIANRGEIACRIIRTARMMGIRTIAVFSEVDAEAAHVALADDAIAIGAAPAAQSYLDGAQIIAAARRAGAGAIHPGYGFLSENAQFADDVQKAGLVFVGPPTKALLAMGQKDTAKALVADAGVPIIPGFHGADQTPKFLADRAGDIGYPVLIKAVAGGGGRGMRRVETPDAFLKALDAARREAKAAFKDDRVLIERLITRPRHIEVQIFADAHGNVVHLFERDCSIQRRHQKVVEEAPAPGMTDALRAAMTEAAVTVARAIGYQGAGTVEFIVDADKGLATDAFYFMEMNTRLQVEHPVTEAITGLDLVEWQLRVAAGEPLPKRQVDIPCVGHAIEVRLCAEDPARNFMPSVGRIARLRLPTAEHSVRVDTGVREGDVVTMFYDSLIAKIIAVGSSRDVARNRLHRAVNAMRICGVSTNLDMLANILRHPSFAGEDLETGFIDRHKDALITTDMPAPDDIVALAALAQLMTEQHNVAAHRPKRATPVSPWDAMDGFRLGAPQERRLILENATTGHEILVRYSGNGDDQRFALSLGPRTIHARGALSDDGVLQATLDGTLYRADVIGDDRSLTLICGTKAWHFATPDPLGAEIHTTADGAICAPLPGRVVNVAVKLGDRVRQGAPLVVLDAMKMEHTLAAGADATVAEVNVAAGDQVAEGDVLIILT